MSEEAAGVDIGKKYDEGSPLATLFHDGPVHMWYWYDDDDDASIAEAVDRISRKVADTLGLRPGEKMLDAGCGPGDMAVLLAKEKDVRVTGITLSEFEIREANERAWARGVPTRVDFQLVDYADLPFPDGSFDAVLALEALQNARDLNGALAEFRRVLRPGGRLSLADFSLESKGEPERVEKFKKSLRISTLPTQTEWIASLRFAGFEVEEYTQCGPRAFGKKSKYLKLAMEKRDEIVARFDKESFDGASRSMRGFFSPRKDQIGYVIMAARKPDR